LFSGEFLVRRLTVLNRLCDDLKSNYYQSSYFFQLWRLVKIKVGYGCGFLDFDIIPVSLKLLYSQVRGTQRE
jgi:hypothetical protein